MIRNTLLVLCLMLCACTPDIRTRTYNALIGYGEGLKNIPSYGIPVYTSGQCIGAVVNGICHGDTMGIPAATCHGTMLNGQCTGPMF